jgi:hypothetical protein
LAGVAGRISVILVPLLLLVEWTVLRAELA